MNNRSNSMNKVIIQSKSQSKAQSNLQGKEQNEQNICETIDKLLSPKWRNKKIFFSVGIETERFIKAKLTSKELLSKHNDVIEYVNKDDSNYGGTASSFRKLSHSIILIFFEAIVTNDESDYSIVNFRESLRENGRDISGKYSETCQALLALIKNCAYISEEEKKIFVSYCFNKLIVINKIANKDNHDNKEIKEFNFQSHVVIPFNILVKTLDSLLHLKHDYFSGLRFHGNSADSIYYQKKPSIEYEIFTNDDKSNSALTVIFEIDDIKSEEQKRKIFSVIPTYKTMMAFTYKLGYSVTSAGLIKNANVSLDSVCDEKTKKKLSGLSVDAETGSVVARLSDEEQSDFYVVIKIQYNDLREKGKSFVKELTVPFKLKKKK